MSTDTEWLQKAKYGHAKKMASEHWSYVERVIKHHQPQIPKTVLETIGYHYTTAMAHGYAHGYEDAVDMVVLNYARLNPDCPVEELYKELDVITGEKPNE